MATGLEAYDALSAATQEQAAGRIVKVNQADGLDLRKLTVADLESRGLLTEIAEEVSSALLGGDFSSLGKVMGLDIRIVPDALSLFLSDRS